MDKSLFRCPLLDYHNDEVQQIVDLISKDPKISGDFSLDWMQQVIPDGWEDQIPYPDDKMCSLNNMSLGGALNDYLLDESLGEVMGEDAFNDSPFDFSLRIFDSCLKDECSKEDDCWDMLEKITSSESISREAIRASNSDSASCRDVKSESGDSRDSSSGGKGATSTSMDSYDSGGGGLSEFGSSSDDGSSSSDSHEDWLDHIQPIVIRPEIEFIFSDDEAEHEEIEDEAENEEVDVINFTDDRPDVFGVKVRRKMTVTENVQCDHSYCSRVTLVSDPVKTNSCQSVRYLPSQQKPKCSRSRSSLNTAQCLPRRQNSKEKCVRRKNVAESSRTISNAKRHSRGRMLKNASEKRQQLNQMERIRRGGLKIDFQRLRLVVPETSSDPKAPKDKILQYALTTIITLEESCKLFEEERERLKHQQNFLRRCLKQNSGPSRKVNHRRV